MTDFAKAWHDTERRYLLGRSPQELIEEEQVAKTPDALALAMGAERLSYRDLNEKANHRAHFLQDRGTGAERLVGVYLDRSIEMVVAFLAIRKAGGACLPLDPKFPKERLHSCWPTRKFQYCKQPIGRRATTVRHRHRHFARLKSSESDKMLRCPSCSSRSNSYGQCRLDGTILPAYFPTRNSCHHRSPDRDSSAMPRRSFECTG